MVVLWLLAYLLQAGRKFKLVRRLSVPAHDSMVRNAASICGSGRPPIAPCPHTDELPRGLLRRALLLACMTRRTRICACKSSPPLRPVRRLCFLRSSWKSTRAQLHRKPAPTSCPSKYTSKAPVFCRFVTMVLPKNHTPIA